MDILRRGHGTATPALGGPTSSWSRLFRHGAFARYRRNPHGFHDGYRLVDRDYGSTPGRRRRRVLVGMGLTIVLAALACFHLPGGTSGPDLPPAIDRTDVARSIPEPLEVPLSPPTIVGPLVVDAQGLVRPLENRARHHGRICSDEPMPMGDGASDCLGLKEPYGKVADTIDPKTGAITGIAGVLGASYGIPTGVVAIRTEGDAVGRDAYLAAVTVDEHGRIVSASPLAQRLGYQAVLVLVAYLVGAMAVAMIRSWRADRGLYAGPGDRMAVIGVSICVPAAFFLSGRIEPVWWEFAPLVAAAAMSFSGIRTFIGRFSLALALCAFVDLLQVPLSPPHASLAKLYGPAGLYVWDFVLLGAACVVGLLLPGRLRHL